MGGRETGCPRFCEVLGLTELPPRHLDFPLQWPLGDAQRPPMLAGVSTKKKGTLDRSGSGWRLGGGGGGGGGGGSGTPRHRPLPDPSRIRSFLGPGSPLG